MPSVASLSSPRPPAILATTSTPPPTTDHQAMRREVGDPSKRKPYLPPDNQFLVTRNVSCLRRAVSVEEEYDAAGAEVVLDDDEVVLDDDVPPCEGWLATHGVQGSKPEEEEDMPSMDTLDTGKAEGIKSMPSYFGAGEKQEDEEDIPDMDTYEDTGDHSATTQPSRCAWRQGVTEEDGAMGGRALQR